MSTSPSAPNSTPDPEDAWLEKLLRRPAAPASPGPRDDADAFTARVVAALPAPASTAARTARRRRTALLLAAAALGCAVAWVFGGAAMMDSLRAAVHLARASGAHLQATEAEIVSGVAGLASIAVAWFLTRRDLRRLFQ